MADLAAVHERFIHVYDNALSPATCGAIIARFERSSGHFTGRTASGVSKNKKSLELYIDPREALWADIDREIFNGLSICIKEYFSNFPWFQPTFKDMGYYIKRYEKGVGYYKEHVDASTLKNAKRFLVIVLYLNTVGEGGETEFTHLGIKVPPVAGRILMFPPMWMYPHQALMPVSDHKYTVNTFLVFDDAEQVGL